MTIRVVLADDQAVVRAGFRALLELTDDLIVVGEATNGREAIELARSAQPDVMVMDIRMPVLDGLAATREIASDPQLDGVRVLVLTTFEVDDYVLEALRAGASGFLLKDVDPPDLYAAIHTVAEGQRLLAPSVTGWVIDELNRREGHEPIAPERLDVLTDREREVAAQVATGRTNEEIGELLIMSPLTVKTHVSRALTKLGVRDRVQLVILAYETGLARIGGDPS